MVDNSWILALRRAALCVAFAVTLTAAGRGRMLESIAVSPSVVGIRPGFTQQLTVVATFSDSSTQTLPASYVTFLTSNSGVAAVTTAGLLKIPANGTVGATATISAVENQVGITSSMAQSTRVAVVAPDTGPTTNSVAAVTATIKDNPLCGSPLTPYYWEIGDQYGPALSGSVGTLANGSPVLNSTAFSIASASKWIYGIYVTQLRGSAAALSSADISFLNFTSGYSYMGSDTSGVTCPNVGYPDSVNQCLTLVNSQGISFAAKNPQTVGSFDYDSGHMENHASQLTKLGNTDTNSLWPAMQAVLGTNANLMYPQPLMAGGIYTTALDYAQILRAILSGSLAMHDALGTSPVCTRHSSTCNATFSPITEAWHYSIGHWVEDDPSTHGDGAFSSPGAYGFYPWIEAHKKYYGIISRQVPTGNGIQPGYTSAQCGRLMRRAWMTGIEQTQSIPTD